MNKLKESVTLGLLFAAGTAGIFAYEEYSDNQERSDILDCYELSDPNAQENCVNSVDAHDGSSLNVMAVAGTIGVIACGVKAYQELSEDRNSL